MLDDKTMATGTMSVTWPHPLHHTPIRSHRSPNH